MSKDSATDPASRYHGEDPSAIIPRTLEDVLDILAGAADLPEGGPDLPVPVVTDGFVADLNALDRFARLVDWLARRIFGVDVDGCRNVHTRVYDRRRYQHNAFQLVPYQHKDPTGHRQAALANAESAFQDLRVLVATIDR